MSKKYVRRVNDMPKRSPKTPAEDISNALLHRRVIGASVDELNLVTRSLKGRDKGAERILFSFVLPLGYTHQLRRARGASPLEEPPGLEELVAELTHRRFRSINKPVMAKVLGVDSYPTGVGVKVDYDDLSEEQGLMTRTVRRVLSLPEDYDIKLGPAEPHIAVTIGDPTTEQYDRIREAVSPDLELMLSAVNPDSPR